MAERMARRVDDLPGVVTDHDLLGATQPGRGEPLRVGDAADDAVEFEISDPEVAEDLAAADPAVATRAVADLRAAFAAKERPDGVWLAAAAWLVCAVAG